MARASPSLPRNEAYSARCSGRLRSLSTRYLYTRSSPGKLVQMLQYAHLAVISARCHSAPAARRSASPSPSTGSSAAISPARPLPAACRPGRQQRLTGVALPMSRRMASAVARRDSGLSPLLTMRISGRHAALAHADHAAVQRLRQADVPLVVLLQQLHQVLGLAVAQEVLAGLFAVQPLGRGVQPAQHHLVVAVLDLLLGQARVQRHPGAGVVVKLLVKIVYLHRS